MDGKEIFRKAVRVVVESAERALADAGLTVDDISLLVPHQANLRIIQAACQRLGIPEERTAVVIDRYGNTSSASIPLALDDALADGPGARRRQPAAHRLRRRHDLGQRRPALGQVSPGPATSPRAGPPSSSWPPGGPAATAGCKPLAPVGPAGEAVIDLLASDALAAGFGPLVLVIGPTTGPAIRYHVEQPWPARVDVRFAAQERPLGTVHAVLSAAERSSARRPLRGGQRRRPLRSSRPWPIWPTTCSDGRPDQRPGRVPAAQRRWSATSPVTRGLCQVDRAGRLVGIDERRQVVAVGRRPLRGRRRPPAGRLDGDDLVSMNLWGFTPAMRAPCTTPWPPAGRRLRGRRGPAARGGGPPGGRGRPADPAHRPSRCWPPRAAASGSPIPTTWPWSRPTWPARSARGERPARLWVARRLSAHAGDPHAPGWSSPWASTWLWWWARWSAGVAAHSSGPVGRRRAQPHRRRRPGLSLLAVRWALRPRSDAAAPSATTGARSWPPWSTRPPWPR